MRSAVRGQSSTELLLMIPVLCALLFAVVELAFWLGGTHYVNYAAFAGARAVQVGREATDATDWLLDGRATRDATVTDDGESVRVDLPWVADLPFAGGLGDMSYDVTVVAGPDEEMYEGLSDPRSAMYADNNCPPGGC